MTAISLTAPTARTPLDRRRRRRPLLGIVAWIAGLIFFLPVAWMILTSFHSEANSVGNPPKLFAPLTIEHYVEFFTGTGAGSPWPALLNSAIASVGSTVIVLILAVPAAYALSIKAVPKWRDVMLFFLSTRMMPAVAGLLPIYFIARNVHLLDNIVLLVILYTGMNLPIAIWMMRSFLQEVPVEILEAAAIDGANLVTIFRQVIIPITSPGIAATALICFIFSWQELLLARSLTGVNAGTAPLFLASVVTGQGGFIAGLAAASILISLPVLIAGIAAQDKLVQGLSLGAVK
jgi:sorbitol/mannitol transport system permease protein